MDQMHRRPTAGDSENSINSFPFEYRRYHINRFQPNYLLAPLAIGAVVPLRIFLEVSQLRCASNKRPRGSRKNIFFIQPL
jgi:hypothetical protein